MPVGRKRATIGLIVVCAAHLLIGADGLSVAIALPNLQHDLGLTSIGAQWTLTVYGVAFGGVLLLGGRLGDLYGRRRFLMLGMTLFAAGSLAAGLAPSLGVLVVARTAQGLGAAAAVPAALALIGTMYPPGRARTRALSLLAAMATVGIMSGLLLGGLITGLLGWRWVFLLMSVPAALSAAAAPSVLPEARAAGSIVRPDVGGALLVSGGTMATLFGLTSVAADGITAIGTVAPLLAGLALLIAFAIWERHASAPLVRFEILRVRSLRSASLAVGANALAFISITYVGTLFLRNALGYDPLRAGVALLPIDVVALVVSLVAAGPLSRCPPRAVLSAAFTLIAAGLLWLARTPVPADYLRDLMAPLVVLGIAIPSVFVVATHEAVTDVEPHERGLASGIFETANHLVGGAIGVAVYATVVAGAAVAMNEARGYHAAFLTAGGLVLVLGTVAVFQARGSAHPGR